MKKDAIMDRRRFNTLLLGGAAAMPGMRAAALSPPARPVMKVGVQLSGTAQWEMQVIVDRGLDAAHGFRLDLLDVADKQAGHIALMAGEADVILSDFVWVAALRAAGEDMACIPHSLAVGGLVVPADSDIASVADLAGKTIGIAGGPMDKSWIVLQAYYAHETGLNLADQVNANFGAPPLINELLAEGQIDAALNFWHFNARAKAAGNVEMISVHQMLRGLGVTTMPPMLAWVFRADVARDRDDAFGGFFDASFAAKAILAQDDAVWETLRERMNAVDDDALFIQLRDDYRRGIITTYDDATIQSAISTFALMARYGGPELVGDATEMDPGTFWSGYRV